jgi:nicotinamidase-related amidase
MKKDYCFLSVDLQNDFATKGGRWHRRRPCVPFVQGTLLPFLEEKGILIREIISDYRQPRPGDPGDGCIPGTWGYQSIIPEEAKHPDIWIKAMNSPIWVRGGIGQADHAPGIPFQDPASFNYWLKQAVGPLERVEIVLFGLTTNVCVLSTAQELSSRGYRVHILVEATDTYKGSKTTKFQTLSEVMRQWAQNIWWDQLKPQLS